MSVWYLYDISVHLQSSFDFVGCLPRGDEENWRGWEERKEFGIFRTSSPKNIPISLLRIYCRVSATETTIALTCSFLLGDSDDVFFAPVCKWRRQGWFCFMLALLLLSCLDRRCTCYACCGQDSNPLLFVIHCLNYGSNKWAGDLHTFRARDQRQVLCLANSTRKLQNESYFYYQDTKRSSRLRLWECSCEFPHSLHALLVIANPLLATFAHTHTNTPRDTHTHTHKLTLTLTLTLTNTKTNTKTHTHRQSPSLGARH
jgi:hypothetical protein